MESQRIFTFVADSLRMAVSGEISSIEPDHIPASPTKNLSMKQGSVQSVDIIISEVIDVDFSCYTWPCAAVMAQYIWYNHQMFQGKVLLEISSGTSLPGILAAKMGASVILSEYSLNSEAIERCRKQATLNNVSVEIAGIMWGNVTWDLLQLPALDYILLADVFYEPAHFTDILFTIKFLLERHPSTKCYLTYQIRDEDWNILFLLQTFGLKCEKIPLDGFGAARGDIAGSSLPGSVDVDLFLCKRVDVEPF